MSQGNFPPGWDEEKVRRVLAHYEEQTEEEALVEDEAGIEPSETVMNVPHDPLKTVVGSTNPNWVRPIFRPPQVIARTG
jgi:hypothetical protein